MKLTFQATEIDHLFSRNEQISIYRIVQEALTNIGKHAQAENIKILIEKNDGAVDIRIEDDGKGFDPARALAKGKAENTWGLPTMKERAGMVGGSLDLWSEEGKGTQISLRIPTGKGRAL